MPHTPAEIPLWRLYDKMVVIAHKTISMAVPSMPINHLMQNVEKHLPILIFSKYILSCITSGGYMIKCARVFYAERSSHEYPLSHINVSLQDLTPLP